MGRGVETAPEGQVKIRREKLADWRRPAAAAQAHQGRKLSGAEAKLTEVSLSFLSMFTVNKDTS